MGSLVAQGRFARVQPLSPTCRQEFLVPDAAGADIQVDAKGMRTGIVVRPYDESHQMIEECMVAANEAVAKELWTKGVKILARLHEAPDAEKLEELRGNLAKLGISCGGKVRNPGTKMNVRVVKLDFAPARPGRRSPSVKKKRL